MSRKYVCEKFEIIVIMILLNNFVTFKHGNIFNKFLNTVQAQLTDICSEIRLIRVKIINI